MTIQDPKATLDTWDEMIKGVKEGLDKELKSIYDIVYRDRARCKWELEENPTPEGRKAYRKCMDKVKHELRRKTRLAIESAERMIEGIKRMRSGAHGSSGGSSGTSGKKTRSSQGAGVILGE